MRIGWKLRMAAAQREVWTGAQLRRLLAERAGLELSSASVSALLTKEPSQIKLSTLLALCTALECTPNDLFDIDTTAVVRPAAATPLNTAAVGGSASAGFPGLGRCRQDADAGSLRVCGLVSGGKQTWGGVGETSPPSPRLPRATPHRWYLLSRPRGASGTGVFG
jgi:putative transcriptional regulator